jgi:hypothetical protein
MNGLLKANSFQPVTLLNVTLLEEKTCVEPEVSVEKACGGDCTEVRVLFFIQISKCAGPFVIVLFVLNHAISVKDAPGVKPAAASSDCVYK